MRRLLDPAVLILMIQYACCFGVELAVDNILGQYFQDHFKYADCVPSLANNQCSILNNRTAGMIASIFALINLFSRASGGLISDIVHHKFGMNGRPLIHFATFARAGSMLILFSYIGNLTNAINVLVLFSIFVQMGCGTSFAIVPYVGKENMGSVSCLVGAFWTVGGAVFGAMFNVLGRTNASVGFGLMGETILVAGAFTSLFLTVYGTSLMKSLYLRLSKSDKQVQLE
jgi:MFS transporter, NNP family, nitrate/nitrite transporter